jgi:hypothetical protein
MKTWIYVGIAGMLALASLPLLALAQSQRHPTDAELQELRQALQQAMNDPNYVRVYPDRRTPGEQESRAALVDAWAEVDPAIAPFLGEWTAIEESLYIYPAATRGEVCVLDVYLNEGDFYSGVIRDGRVYTTTNLVFFLNDNYLSSAFVYNDQPETYEYANPRPLPDSLAQLEQYYPEMMAAFHAAACQVGLPSSQN